MTDFVYDTRPIVDEPLIVTVNAGSTKTVGIDGSSENLAIRQLPGGGGTSGVDVTLNSWSQIDSAVAEWIATPAGTVSVDTDETIQARNIRGLRLTATTVNAVFHIG